MSLLKGRSFEPCQRTYCVRSALVQRRSCIRRAWAGPGSSGGPVSLFWLVGALPSVTLQHSLLTTWGEDKAGFDDNTESRLSFGSNASTSQQEDQHEGRDGVEPSGRGALLLPQDFVQPPMVDNIVTTFAYGANMNFLTLARRDVRVLSRDPAVVADPAMRLVFKHQGGYATLERVDENGSQEAPRFQSYDGQVHGVVYRVTREDFDKLAKREGGYVVQEVQVQTYDGTPYRALAFVSNPLFKLPQEVTPTEKYLALLRDGARDNYLDPGYQAFLSGISTVPSAGLGSEYFNTPSKYMGYSFLVVVALITVAFFFQH